MTFTGDARGQVRNKGSEGPLNKRDIEIFKTPIFRNNTRWRTWEWRNYQMYLIMDITNLKDSELELWCYGLSRKLKFHCPGVVSLKSLFDLGAGKPMSWVTFWNPIPSITSVLEKSKRGNRPNRRNSLKSIA